MFQCLWHFYDAADVHKGGEEMIKIARIDHRLIHGQVAFAWTGYLGITRIIVIDNDVVHDELRSMTLKMAKPVGVKLNILEVKEAADKMQKIDKLDDNIMLLFENTAVASEFLKLCPVVKELNLGGIQKTEQSKRYGNAVYLNQKQEDELREVQDLNIQVYAQAVPTEERSNIKL